MTKIPIIDGGFLLTESHHSPKHVGGLAIFRLPKGKGPAWLRKLLDDMRQEKPGFPFNQRLRENAGIQYELEPDDHLEMDYQVRHTVLPHPGSHEQLLDVVARLHANLLDRERPLWEFHLIEGLSGRRFAFYTKIHHSLCDGITFGRWFAEAGATSAKDKDSHAIWRRDEVPGVPDDDIGYVELIMEGVKALGGGIKTALEVSALSAKLIQKRFLDGDTNIALPLAAPRTKINVAPGAQITGRHHQRCGHDDLRPGSEPVFRAGKWCSG
jgi:diacylglycerol O-acyltransferase